MHTYLIFVLSLASICFSANSSEITTDNKGHYDIIFENTPISQALEEIAIHRDDVVLSEDFGNAFGENTITLSLYGSNVLEYALDKITTTYHISKRIDNGKVHLSTPTINGKIIPSKPYLKYSDKTVTYTPFNVSLSTFLEMLARESGYEVRAAGTISGNVFVRIEDQPWDKVFDYLINENHLFVKVKGKRMLITDKKWDSIDDYTFLSDHVYPMPQVLYKLKYIDSQKIIKMIKEAKVPVGHQRIFSKRGHIAFDKQTNTLISPP